MINTIIIENEKRYLDSLTDDLKTHCANINIIGHSGKVKEGIELINRLKPELIFLDIELDDGTGFELLEKIHQQKDAPQVIFITSFNEFAVKAFRFCAIDYLMKPAESKELTEAIKKAEEKILSKNLNANLNVLFENLKQQGQHQKIVLPGSDSISVYKIENIIRCESDRNYTLFYFTGEKPLLVSKTMKEYEELLSSYGFERIHKSHLINMAYVKKYVKTDGGYIEMQDGTAVPVAQSKREQIVKILSGS